MGEEGLGLCGQGGVRVVRASRGHIIGSKHDGSGKGGDVGVRDGTMRVTGSSRAA